jgi:arylsulfatase A-like enzyme
VYYYRDTTPFAIRKGDYKAHFTLQLEYGNDQTAHYITSPPFTAGAKPTVPDLPLLYNLATDPSEKYDIAADHPEIIRELRELLDRHLKTVVPVENQLEKF